MNYGLYLSAAGAVANLFRQDVIANNLANLNTTGFKPDMVAARQRLPERLEDPGSFADPQWLLEQLGGGQLLMPTTVQLKQGQLVGTKNDLDLALQGDGFFVVSDGRGTGADSIRLTRDGRFTLNNTGELVMTGTGLKVLNENDQPIRLSRDAKTVIDSDGAIRQNGVITARIQITAAPAAADLIKAGDNLLKINDASSFARAPGAGRVHQGFLESSAVDPITTLTAMIAATKAVQSNVQMMQYHDNMLGQTINTFARVA
ncbi:MAG: flagellar hook-basal body protein [Phycisphaerales bacterium]|nr:MAG: flagellar hook-basal body protein [Phycisphaerales bacterium]